VISRYPHLRARRQPGRRPRRRRRRCGAGGLPTVAWQRTEWSRRKKSAAADSSTRRWPAVVGWRRRDDKTPRWRVFRPHDGRANKNVNRRQRDSTLSNVYKIYIILLCFCEILYGGPRRKRRVTEAFEKTRTKI